MSSEDRCSGFKIRGLNADCDKLAVQSSEEETWLLGRTAFKGSRPKVHEVALQEHEIKVLRPYGGCPEVEITPLGDSNALVVIDQTQTRRRAFRMGQKIRLTLKHNESVVIHDAYLKHPNAGFGPIKQV